MKQKNVRKQGEKYFSPNIEFTFFEEDVIVMSGETADPKDVDVSWNPAWD